MYYDYSFHPLSLFDFPPMSIPYAHSCQSFSWMHDFWFYIVTPFPRCIVTPLFIEGHLCDHWIDTLCWSFLGAICVYKIEDIDFFPLFHDLSVANISVVRVEPPEFLLCLWIHLSLLYEEPQAGHVSTLHLLNSGSCAVL